MQNLSISLPHAQLGPLESASGSAVCTALSHSVLCSVNGPLEVSKRDELPLDALVSVTVRPFSGLSGIAFRHMELKLRQVLTDLMLTRLNPRSQYQIVLQLLTPCPSTSLSLTNVCPSRIFSLPLLSTLFNASILALIDAKVPLRCIAVAILIGILPQNTSPPSSSTTSTSCSQILNLDPILLSRLIVTPSINHYPHLTSLHLFIFSCPHQSISPPNSPPSTSNPNPPPTLFLSESDGNFTFSEYLAAHNLALRFCYNPQFPNPSHLSATLPPSATSTSNSPFQLPQSFLQTVGPHAILRKWLEFLVTTKHDSSLANPQTPAPSLFAF